MKRDVSLSKNGIPCIWESGGGYSNTGNSRLIGDKNGNPKKAIYVRRCGELACMEHALIPIRINDIVVEANHHRGDFDIDIYRIVSIDIDSKKAEMELINNFSEEQWDKNLDEKYEDIVDSAIRKAKSYHCRTVYFVKGEE